MMSTGAPLSASLVIVSGDLLSPLFAFLNLHVRETHSFCSSSARVSNGVLSSQSTIISSTHDDTVERHIQTFAGLCNNNNGNRLILRIYLRVLQISVFLEDQPHLHVVEPFGQPKGRERRNKRKEPIVQW
jgi:hypothetical protein